MDPFVYNFVLGGAVCVFGAVLAWRQGSLGLSGRGLRNLCLVLGVVSFYFILQAFLQYQAPGMPSAEALPYKPTPQSQAAVDPGQGYRGATIDYAIMIGYFAIIVVLGAFFGRRMKTTDDFFFRRPEVRVVVDRVQHGGHDDRLVQFSEVFEQGLRVRPVQRTNVQQRLDLFSAAAVLLVADFVFLPRHVDSRIFWQTLQF